MICRKYLLDYQNYILVVFQSFTCFAWRAESSSGNDLETAMSAQGENN